MRKSIHDARVGYKRTRRRWSWLVLACAALVAQGGIALAQTPFVGQIEMFAGNFAPVGWMFCEGQLLSISENPTLFNLIGTTYGGDGVQTFALPDLRGRVIISAGQGPGLSNYVIGQTGGAETVTLTQAQLPPHGHALYADSMSGASDNPTGHLPANSPDGIPSYGIHPVRAVTNAALQSSGAGQPHNNVKPYLVIRYIIAIVGVYPSQN